MHKNVVIQRYQQYKVWRTSFGAYNVSYNIANFYTSLDGSPQEHSPSPRAERPLPPDLLHPHTVLVHLDPETSLALGQRPVQLHIYQLK
jgi:hypothetical protein